MRREPPLIRGGQGRDPRDLEADARFVWLMFVLGLALFGALVFAVCAGVE